MKEKVRIKQDKITGDVRLFFVGKTYRIAKIAIKDVKKGLEAKGYLVEYVE